MIGRLEVAVRWYGPLNTYTLRGWRIVKQERRNL